VTTLTSLHSGHDVAYFLRERGAGDCVGTMSYYTASGVTWRLNSGVPPTEIAAWAGHSVEMLMRVYAKCMTGLEDVWISRMDDALRLEDTQRAQDRGGG